MELGEWYSLVSDDFPKAIRRNCRVEIYLGDKAFVARMQSALAKDEVLQEIPCMQRRPIAKSLAEFRSEYAHTPHTGMALAYLSGNRSMKAIAEVFECIMLVSRAVKAYERNHGKLLICRHIEP